MNRPYVLISVLLLVCIGMLLAGNWVFAQDATPTLSPIFRTATCARNSNLTSCATPTRTLSGIFQTATAVVTTAGLRATETVFEQQSQTIMAGEATATQSVYYITSTALAEDFPQEIVIHKFMEIQRIDYSGSWLSWHDDGIKLTVYSAPYFVTWDTLSGEVVKVDEVGYGHWGCGDAVPSPDGRLYAINSCLSESNDVLITADWDREEPYLFTDPLILRGHTDAVSEFAWSPDSKYLASGSRDTTVRIWDISTGEEVIVLEHGGSILGIAWTVDGTRLASSSADGTIRIWGMPSE